MELYSTFELLDFKLSVCQNFLSMKGWDPFPLSKCETNCVHITVPYVLLLIIKVSDQFVKYRDRFKMKILIFLLILPAISLAGIPNPIQISCVRCQYRTDFPWLHKLNIGSISSSCGCSAPFPIKVKLAQTGRYCCHNYCPTSPSYTLNSCICGYSTFTWFTVAPCLAAFPNSKCCIVV